MADEAEVNLVRMRPEDRVIWLRRQLVRLPGEVVEIDGKHWKVLEHHGGLPQLLLSLATGQLTHPVCRDLNGRLKSKGWRQSDSMEHDSHQMIHRILILPEDGLVPAIREDKPVADAEPAGTVEPETDELDVGDLERAAEVLRWAAGEIRKLRAMCSELMDSNDALRGQLDDAKAAAQAHPRPPARVVALFRDGLSEVSGLQQP